MQEFNFFSLFSESEKDSTALMLAALEGDEIIVDILVACVSKLTNQIVDARPCTTSC